MSGGAGRRTSGVHARGYVRLDISTYVGQWVVICDEKVVAHSGSFKDVYALAKERCCKSKPFIALVPTDETVIL